MGGDPRRPADESSVHLDRQGLGTPGPDEFARRRRRWFTAIGAACALFLFLQVPWLPYRPFCSDMWTWPGWKLHLFPEWLETKSFFEDEGFTIKGGMTEAFAEHVTAVFKRSGVRVIRSGNLVLIRPLDQYGFGGQLGTANWAAIDHFAEYLPADHPHWATMSPEMKRRIRDLTQRARSGGGYSDGVFGDCDAARALIMENGGRSGRIGA